MKKILMAVVVVAGAMLLSAEMPRSEWHAKVGDCALDPNALKETMSQLSSADKTAFLAEVNAAIDKMPGSAESKAAKFLAANRAAVAGAGPADRAAVLAEVFATVPLEVLTVINEEFAKNEFARPGMMKDFEFTNIVAQTMAKIVQRTSDAESGAVRAGFAGLMFIRAAGTAADGAESAVIAALPSEVQGDAGSVWFPAALGKDGATPSYDPMLAPAMAGEEVDPIVVTTIAPANPVESMLSDLQSGASVSGESHGTIPGTGAGASSTGGNDGTDAADPMSGSLVSNPRDRVADPDSPYYQGKTRTGGGGSPTPTPEPTPEPQPEPQPEPGPYWLQGL